MVKLNRLYTRTGDDGSTGLVDGSRVAKDGARIAAIGEVDEVNAALGLATLVAGGETREMLARVQNELFDLGADLATPGEDFAPSAMSLRVTAAQVARLEQEIDGFTAATGPLTSFILPGGSELAARLHLARTVARRAERAGVTAAREGAVNPEALAYLNRLSDWLFALSRAVNADGPGDVLWVPGASR